MHDLVDEQRGGPQHLAGFEATAVVTLDALERWLAGSVAVELDGVQAELIRVAAQIVVLERLLPVKEHGVHFPEAAMRRRGLRRQ